MLLRMWGKRSPYMLSVRLKMGAATIDINMEAFQKPANSTII